MSCIKSDTVRIVNYYKNLGANITVEVTPHQLTLCDMDIKNSNYKMNPPLSTPDVRDALVEALRNGKIDCISTDHAPHTKEEKEADLLHAPFGIIGLETAFPVLYTDLVKKGHLELKELLILLNKKPAQIMKLKENKLEVGADANIVVVNLENEYEITPDFFKSKATNSPYIGKKVYGRIEKHIIKEKLCMKDKKLVLKDGTVFEGISYAADKDFIGELVFNTSMVGYQEIATDPSYKGQIVVMTYPLIGNYGVNADDGESKKCHLVAMICHEYNDCPSNFRYTQTLSEMFWIRIVDFLEELIQDSLQE